MDNSALHPTIEHAMRALESLTRTEYQREAARTIRAALRDVARIDWLADPSNTIGNIQLPRECVESNVHSLRNAIDAARAMAVHE